MIHSKQREALVRLLGVILYNTKYMADEVTPAAPVTTEAPVTPAATPSTTPPATTVTLAKDAHDQLQRDAARARENQRKADLFDRQNKTGSRFGSAAPVTPPTEEERIAAGHAEDKKAERGITRLAADPAFRDVLDADPTLRTLFLENPLAVLPILAPDALDADDAITLVKDALHARKKPVETTPATPPVTPKVPPVGAVDTRTDADVATAVEAAKKLPNTEQSIAAMIAAKVGKKG